MWKLKSRESKKIDFTGFFKRENQIHHHREPRPSGSVLGGECTKSNPTFAPKDLFREVARLANPLVGAVRPAEEDLPPLTHFVPAGLSLSGLDKDLGENNLPQWQRLRSKI